MAVAFVYFGNPEAALTVRIHRWLCERGDKPLFCVYDKPSLDKLPQLLAGEKPLGLSVKYRHIIPPHVLALFSPGIANLHNSLLPWNRGRHTNVWPIIDGSPAGVSLHYMDEGVDTGPLLAQDRIEVLPWDTAESLYHRLDDAAFNLFTDHWPYLDKLVPIPQPEGGSVHRAEELRTLDCLETGDLDTAVATMRARSFPGYPGVKMWVDGRRVEATINLREVKE